LRNLSAASDFILSKDLSFSSLLKSKISFL
jgi:hypothetical protein